MPTEKSGGTNISGSKLPFNFKGSFQNARKNQGAIKMISIVEVGSFFAEIYLGGRRKEGVSLKIKGGNIPTYALIRMSPS